MAWAYIAEPEMFALSLRDVATFKQLIDDDDMMMRFYTKAYHRARPPWPAAPLSGPPPHPHSQHPEHTHIKGANGHPCTIPHPISTSCLIPHNGRTQQGRKHTGKRRLHIKSCRPASSHHGAPPSHCSRPRRVNLFGVDWRFMYHGIFADSVYLWGNGDGTLFNTR